MYFSILLNKMKNSQVLGILLIFLNFLNIFGSPQLDEFLKSVKDVNSEFQLFDHITISETHRRKRSASVEDLLSRFEFNDDDVELHDSDLEGGDAWYQSFRTMECRHGGCPKRPLRWKIKKSQPDDYYEYYEETDDPEKSSDLKDQWEETQNDLSHEANYKLSKVEQDAAEDSLPSTAWPIRHNPKRNADPMEMVKLKTSLRMQKYGDGPSLPSSSLEENRRKITVDDILADSKHDENPDPWKESYEVLESRKLLSVRDTDGEHISDENICRTKDCQEHTLDMQQFDNIKQKTQMDRELEGLTFDNTDNEADKHMKKATIKSLGDELLHSAVFLKLQSLLKGKTKSSKPTPEPKTNTSRPVTPVPLNLIDKDRNVNINLHMSVNATLLGDNKLPSEFHRNNTITFKPPTEKPKKKPKKAGILGLSDLDFFRDRRGILFPILSPNTKRKTNSDISKSVIEATENFPLDEIITGKLTSQLVQTIFALVRSSPSLKVLWPGLKRNKVTTSQQVQNFDAIRTEENESEMHRTEVMLRQAMETINAIIEQQVRSRSCVPLRSDLKAFYNLILATKAENDRLQDRQKRETELNTPVLSDTQVQKKSRIVKKLLKEYEDLPPEDQDQVTNIKQNLLIASEELKGLREAARRKKRQIVESHMLNPQTSFFESREVDSQISPQYIRLAKTAEMLLHNSLKDPDLSNFNYI